MKKMYCLVVIDDFSRFTWVFFLATKDETSGILKSFITGIENLVDHKVKVIRCDNGTEFKNKEMNQFCEMKGILRQYSVARTPQQNGVAERRNKIEYLIGKFNGKADEGFFVRYSLNSKAFRVFNSRTRIVEENLHIRFSENTPNVVGSGPDWLFDIDALTRTMNYKPIVAGTQSNGFAGTKASDNAGQARKETEPVKNYILLPLWPADPPFSQDPKSSQDDGSKPSSDDEKKVDEDPRKDSESIDQEKDDNVNSTNNVNAASTNKVNVVGGKTSIELPDDPNMPTLEDISIFDLSRDNEDVGAEADMNNLDTTIQVSPIPTTRIHKDHPLNQVIRDLQSATQTRNISKNLEEHEFLVLFNKEQTIKTFKTACLLAFYHRKNPKRKIKEEVYVCQPPRFEDLDFPDRVYKVEKALYGLHQAPRACRKKDGIFISQDKYVGEILKKIGFTEVKTASTLIETQKPLLKDEDGEELDVHMYRSMISSLMYLTSSRPAIMFAVCVCARYQVNPKVSHLVRIIKKDLEGDDLLLHDAEMEVMNMILLSIPNEIYNSVDACTSAKDMRSAFRLAKQLTVDSFDDLFDYLQQFEKLVNASRAKKLEKSHDPLALVAHTGLSSRQTSSYYVTHPTSVVDYDDEYQNQAIIQGDRVNIQSRNSGNTGRNGRRAYVQEEVVEGMNAPKETGNVQRTLRIPSSGNTSTVQCYNCSEKGHYARNYPKPRVRDSKYFMEQMLLAKQDEAGVILTDEQNDFLFADASRMEEIEELSANICLMARIQPADHTSDDGPSYESAFISEVQSSSIDENNEPMYPTHTKIINSTIGDDQINSNIKFDSFKGNVNSGSIENNTHAPDLCAV
ncbi:uncharacterized mitochondrial protein-like protein [Tanacetum coccineum]